MAKLKKKRNKPYRGADAKNSPGKVIRIEAVKRNKFQQWWLDNKRIAKPVIIIAVIAVIVAIIVTELIRLIFM